MTHKRETLRKIWFFPKRRWLEQPTWTSILCTMLFIHILAPNSEAQEWRRQESGTTTHLDCIFFVDSVHGWAAGEKGLILATTDGGEHWNRQFTPSTTTSYKAVFFISEKVGWAVGGPMDKTTDGGMTWIRQDSVPMRRYMDVFFLNEHIGWVVGGDIVSMVVLRTDNGGRTWRMLVDSAISSGCRGVHFVDENHGWIAGYPGIDNFDPDKIFHTSDGGETWSEQISPKVRAGLFDVCFINQKIGWMTGRTNNGDPTIKTSNGGMEWILNGPESFSNMATFFSIVALDSENVWVGGRGIYRTTNGGILWFNEMMEQPGSVYSLCILNEDLRWASGFSGAIWRWVARISSMEDNHHDIGINLRVAIHPNYADGSLLLEYETNVVTDVRTEIFDYLGQRRLDCGYNILKSGKNTFRIGMSDLRFGAYYARTECNRLLYYNKFINN